MIVVKVELRSAVTGKTTLLGEATISNNMAQTIASNGVIGSYDVFLRGKRGRMWRSGEVRNFPRKRLLAWDLLSIALNQIVGDRR